MTGTKLEILGSFDFNTTSSIMQSDNESMSASVGVGEVWNHFGKHVKWYIARPVHWQNSHIRLCKSSSPIRVFGAHCSHRPSLHIQKS